MSYGGADHKEWQVPESDRSESYRLGWLDSAVEQGESWNTSQRGFSDWRKALDIISGTGGGENVLKYRSRLSGNRLKTNVRTAIAGLANIRPIWGYHASKTYSPLAEMMNKTARALYLMGMWDQSIKEALAYAAATCTGWVRPVYQRDLQGKGNINLLTYGMPCVLPVQMPSNGDYQRAYAVSLLDEVPIYEAHWKFPTFQDRLKPTNSRYWYSSDIRGAAKGNALKAAWNWFSRKKESKLADLYIPIRWTTINDCRINETGQTIGMGQLGSSWYYEVPSYRQELPGGKIADENDARLYPYRRLIISSESCIMYDGPAFSWHGQLDLIPFCVDKWPWEPMGFSMVHDGWELQKALDQIDRGTMDKINAQQDLPLGYDMNAVSKREADEFDPMEPRARIAFDGSQVDKPFAPPVEAEVYRVTPETLQFREVLQGELDYTLQTRDIVEMNKAQALGKSMDQLEALIAANGPIVKDVSRSMENSLSMVGTQVGYQILQNMPTARIMQYVDPETMAAEVFDYDPATIVPSHMPGEIVHAEDQTALPSKYTQMQRARWFASQLPFYLMPHSVHEATQMSYRLLLLQMRQRGAPISWATIMKSCEVQNVGEVSGVTEQDQYASEKETEITQLARIQLVVQGLGMDAPSSPGGPPGVTMPEGGGGATPQGGRPPSFNAPPQLEVKGDGRPVVSTSN